jgi:cyclopropane-fatty-acyl-phospholipid synthase
MSAVSSVARKLFLKSLRSISAGSLVVTFKGESFRYGEDGTSPSAQVDIHDERFFERALRSGEIGLGESYMEGEWTSPDLVAVIRLAVRNMARFEARRGTLRGFAHLIDVVRHRMRGNTVEGSRRNIGAHYDLSNDFFRLFLDESMLYSCALYEQENDSLERAQFQKLERICRKLKLSQGEHVLEIGTGWGAFAEHAAKHYGIRVTTTTISQEQYDFATRRLAHFGDRVKVLLDDYRHLTGKFDHIVSIEMFEAVGLRFYDTFFSACDRLLKPEGSMLLQTITLNEQSFATYRAKTDWIQKYIFPGGELASVSEILQSLARATRLSLYHAEDIGTHYARTLSAWRERFQASLTEVYELGFDDRFVRMWDYYLAYCEGAFLERHVGDVQLLLSKTHSQRVLFEEPWSAAYRELSTNRLSAP